MRKKFEATGMVYTICIKQRYAVSKHNCPNRIITKETLEIHDGDFP